jgi:hypothetical protein
MLFNRPVKNAARLLAPVLIAFLGVLFLLASAHNAAGQEEEEAWAAPVNLSKSGSAADPQIIGDSLNTLHAIWQDTIDSSFVHARTTEEGWSDPVTVEVPFGTRRFYPDLPEDDPTPLFSPRMAAGPEGVIHAVWVDEVRDLYHTRVQADGFDAYENWSGRLKVGTEVLTATQKVGGDGRLHLAYVQMDDVDEAAAGLYYRYSDDQGENWSEPVALQTSAYFRLLTNDTVNFQLVTDNSIVYVAWDDNQNGRVYTIRSADNGATWEAVNEIDRREEEDPVNAISPSGITISARDGLVHAVWRAGHDGENCGVYHVWSQDSGQTWKPRERTLDQLISCPTDVELLTSAQSPFILGAVTDRFLSAWTESRWRSPETQPVLSSFINPETFRPVFFTCGQQALTREDELWVVSCGVDETQDIWVQQRSLAPLLRPVAGSPWDSPVGVTEGALPIAEPAYVADEEGRFHAFWVETARESNVQFGPLSTSIQYSQYVDGRWARPVSILSSPSGKTEQPTVAVDGRGRIFAAWSGGDNGEIYFSSASTGGASLPSDWSRPQMLTEEGRPAESPKIAIGPLGTIYVIYSVPLLEGRGIKMVTSADNGASWSEPIVVFDGVAANWEMVSEPRLAIDASGALHLQMLHSPLPTSIRGNELYYIQSRDGGASWSEAVRISSVPQETSPVLWHTIVSSGDKIIYRAWQEWTFERLNIWTQASFDGGVTWSEPIQAGVLETSDVPTALVADAAGQAHLFYSAVSGIEGVNSRLVINHSILQGAEWQEAEPLTPDRRTVTGVRALAALSHSDQISLLFSASVQIPDVLVSGEQKDVPEEVVEVVVSERLYNSSRRIQLAEELPTPPPQVSVTPAPTVAPDATTTPEPTPTLVFPTNSSPPPQGLLPGSLNDMAGIIFGFGAAALLVIGLFILIGVNRVRSR